MHRTTASQAGHGYKQPTVEQIVNTVATYLDVSALDLPPLFEHLNCDSINRLFEPAVENGLREGRVDFRYCGLDVAVIYEGDTRIVEVDDSRQTNANQTSPATAD